MIDLTGTNNVPKGNTAVAMGLFDGVHHGHRAVIGKAVEAAESIPGVKPAVFTFDTQTVTSKGESGSGVEYIFSREMKLDIIGRLGVKYIYSPDFMNFRDLSGEEFTELVLCDKFSAKIAVCGEDFRFGKNACCGVSELAEMCRKRGIKLITVSEISEGGEKISSTSIRKLIGNGEISEANRLLGSKFAFRLPIVYGRQLGRTLDFPTINQYIPKRQIKPRFGVYASETEVGGNIYGSVTNIGVKPTVGSEAPLAETYIIDFPGGDLYGETAKVSLVEFIRPERKFSGTDELKAQIAQDTESARMMLQVGYPGVKNK